MVRSSSDILSLTHAWFGTFHKMDTMEKLPYDFGTGDLINRSEIHMIGAIGTHNDINVTDLAELLEVSKSAISQMIRKLSEKDLVEKYRDPENDKEVLLRLTPRGKIAYHGHEQYHARYDAQMLKNIGPLTDEEFDIIKRFIDAVDITADASLEKKI